MDFERDISSKLDEASNLQGTKAQEAFDALPEKIAQAREVYTDKNLNARQKFLFSKKTKDMENGFLIRANSIQAQKAMQDKLKAMSQELKNKINDVALTWNTPVFEQNLQTLKDLVAEQQSIIGTTTKMILKMHSVKLQVSYSLLLFLVIFKIKDMESPDVL